MPPSSDGARAAFLDRQVAGHAALRHLEADRGKRYVVYVLGAPDLTYYARGRLLGQARGPYRVGRVRPLLANAAGLHRALLEADADHFLIVGALRDRMPRNADFARRFSLRFADDRSELFALAPVPGPE